MEHHIEEDRSFFQTEKGLEEDEMAGAADGKKFGQPLNDAKKYGLVEINLNLLNRDNQLISPKFNYDEFVKSPHLSP